MYSYVFVLFRVVTLSILFRSFIIKKAKHFFYDIIFIKKSNRNPSRKHKMLTIRPVFKIINFITNHLNLSYHIIYVFIKIISTNFITLCYLSYYTYIVFNFYLKNKKKGVEVNKNFNKHFKAGDWFCWKF